MTTQEYEQFKDLELRLGLFDYKIEDIWIWERIRFQVKRSIDQELGAGQMHSRLELSPSYRARQLLLLLNNLFYRNALLADKTDILFYGHERRVQLDDGKWWDIFCDPISSAIDHSYVHIEDDYMQRHRRPMRTGNVYYLDFINQIGSLERFFGLNSVDLSSDTLQWVHTIESEIHQLFHANVNVQQVIHWHLSKRESNLKYYRFLLDRTEPKVAILPVAYGKETFVEACKERDIPVIELQHGAIHGDHPGYDFPSGIAKRTFPDHLFIWGDYWRHRATFPANVKSVTSAGYPYLDMQKARLATSGQDKRGIVFISQGTVGRDLSQLAVALSSADPDERQVIYKLHPGEYDRWKEEYPWLLNSRVTVVDEAGPELHEVLSSCEWQVGVNSTALYEGIAFGAKTLLYTGSTVTPLMDLVESGAADTIVDLNDLINKVRNSKNDLGAVDTRDLFAGEAMKKIKKAIHSIIST